MLTCTSGKFRPPGKRKAFWSQSPCHDLRATLPLNLWERKITANKGKEVNMLRSNKLLTWKMYLALQPLLHLQTQDPYWFQVEAEVVDGIKWCWVVHSKHVKKIIKSERQITIYWNMILKLSNSDRECIYTSRGKKTETIP